MDVINEFNQFIKQYKKLEFTQHIIQDLNIAEIHTIVVIGQQSDININLLAKIRHISKSAASQLISKLVSKQLVRKQRCNDNKTVGLSLTNAGQAIFNIHDTQQKYIVEQLQAVFSGYSQREIALIIGFMKDVEDVWENLPWLSKEINHD